MLHDMDTDRDNSRAANDPSASVLCIISSEAGCTAAHQVTAS